MRRAFIMLKMEVNMRIASKVKIGAFEWEIKSLRK